MRGLQRWMGRNETRNGKPVLVAAKNKNHLIYLRTSLFLCNFAKGTNTCKNRFFTSYNSIAPPAGLVALYTTRRNENI